MKKLLSIFAALSVMFSMTQGQASSTIESFVPADKVSAYFNCAYKLKIASKKCLVTKSYVSSAVDTRTKAFYGNKDFVQLTMIKWPDGDISRYVSMDSFEVINLADKKSYRYKTTDMDSWYYNLEEGLIILDDKGKEHIRLW